MSYATPLKPCGSPRKHGQPPCKRGAGWGTDHPGYGRCKLHGGRAPGGNVHAERERVAEEMRTYGVDRQIDPAAGLLEEIARTAGHIDWLRGEIEKLNPQALIFGVTSLQTVQGRKPSAAAGSPQDHDGEKTTTVGPGVHTYLELYLKERAHFVTVCARAIAAGIAERHIKLAEKQGEIASAAVRGILDGLRLSEEQRRAVPDLVAQHLAPILSVVA